MQTWTTAERQPCRTHGQQVLSPDFLHPIAIETPSSFTSRIHQAISGWQHRECMHAIHNPGCRTQNEIPCFSQHPEAGLFYFQAHLRLQQHKRMHTLSRMLRRTGMIALPMGPSRLSAFRMMAARGWRMRQSRGATPMESRMNPASPFPRTCLPCCAE